MTQLDTSAGDAVPSPTSAPQSARNQRRRARRQVIAARKRASRHWGKRHKHRQFRRPQEPRTPSPLSAAQQYHTRHRHQVPKYLNNLFAPPSYDLAKSLGQRKRRAQTLYRGPVRGGNPWPTASSRRWQAVACREKRGYLHNHREKSRLELSTQTVDYRAEVNIVRPSCQFHSTYA
eukprot:TRINITY_DN2643_c0_g1_i1.p1 TRINITY_DN2643_c0_g1~~TRINITY_DN2643_c0_g1_i1.p1  ORF type:complete len:176 (+),score=25.68 TRINITY_DN2643_c0_g1_i1:252-779(+)